MRSALIGATGFVGSTLLRTARFDDCYRSTNIEDIAGRAYDLVICAGAPAEKWRANREPVADRVNLDRLMLSVSRADIGHLVLISTVDVFGSPVGVDESTIPDEALATPYGRHRLQLERFLSERFPTTCLRLPGLYGPGLKKNVIFDLLTDNRVDLLVGDSQFQFYPLDRLWSDIAIARAHSLPVVHCAVEPVRVDRIATDVFARTLNPSSAPAAHYDLRTRYAAHFGGSGAYFQSATESVAQIKEFVAQWRSRSL